jgi:hypothetical protein
MSSRTSQQVMEREEKRLASGARPYTGLAAWWDKVDGDWASIIVAASMAVGSFIIASVINLIF